MTTITRTKAPRSRPAGSPAAGEPTPPPSPFTRSALPIALSWFVVPALVLVLAEAFGWHLW